MYIQSPKRNGPLPRGYHGSAFSESEPPASPPPVRASQKPPAFDLGAVPPAGYRGSAFAADEAKNGDIPPDGIKKTQNTAENAESAAGANGLLGRFPFLSSLLPARAESTGEGDLSDRALIAVLFLLLSDREHASGAAAEVLPLLLLLLLWE